MTHFLEVGFMREGLQEILDSALRLRYLLSLTPDQRNSLEQARMQQGELTTYADDVRAALQGVLLEAQGLVDFLDRFEAAPVIYTGDGSTAEVMAMLERLVTLADQPEPPR
ncbi:MAG: hypothetical protein ACM3XM_21080 [Mycobacterium leprae]